MPKICHSEIYILKKINKDLHDAILFLKKENQELKNNHPKIIVIKSDLNVVNFK